MADRTVPIRFILHPDIPAFWMDHELASAGAKQTTIDERFT